MGGGGGGGGSKHLPIVVVLGKGRRQKGEAKCLLVVKRPREKYWVREEIQSAGLSGDSRCDALASGPVVLRKNTQTYRQGWEGRGKAVGLSVVRLVGRSVE